MNMNRYKDNLAIRIICAPNNHLLNEYAENLQHELCKLGHKADIGQKENPQADVNHYMYEDNLTIWSENIKVNVRTILLTCIDSIHKKEFVKNLLQNNLNGICMSTVMMRRFIDGGVPENRIYCVDPTLDMDIKPKKIVLGITNRCYHYFDLRKRDDLILHVCQQLEPQFFRLKIMGSGWDIIVEQLEHLGFEVDYYPLFDRKIYKKLIANLDYWIYYGFDEGAMGYLDALAAGIKTIATPQGFHLDTKYGLTFPCETIQDFARVLLNIQAEKKEIIDTVRGWNGEKYAKSHLKIWQHLICKNKEIRK